MQYASISDNEERLVKAIVDAAYAVHSALGPGLLENFYEVCFCHELAKRGLSYLDPVETTVNDCKRLNFLINFNVRLIKQGLKRVAL